MSRERAKNEAQAYANDVIPRAVGSAARLKEEAEAYKSRVVSQSQGDAQRFSSVLAQYQKAPQVTRDRMYLETMQQIYANVTKVLVDARQGSSLLYLPLDRLLQQATGSSTAVPGTEPQGSASNSSSSSAPSGSGSAGTSSDSRTRDGGRSRERETR